MYNRSLIMYISVYYKQTYMPKQKTIKQMLADVYKKRQGS